LRQQHQLVDVADFGHRRRHGSGERPTDIGQLAARRAEQMVFELA
jgi:hypothetical protein